MAKIDPNKRPIIIKRVKKVTGGGHHGGGAWKVAYADFVTAMMAFFLLLWLLSTAPQETLSGISDYFTPTIGLKDSEGIGFKGGEAASSVGISKDATTQPGVVFGKATTGPTPENPDTTAAAEGDQEANLFREGASALKQAFTSEKTIAQYSENITVEQTPDGLKIDLMDSDKYPMYEGNTPNLTEHGQMILSRMVGIIKRIPNYITITGHTDASPAEAGREQYSNWELSADRANAARRFLVKSGIESEQPKKIVGLADKDLIMPSEPRNPRNRRISILLMKNSHLLLPGNEASKDVVADPAAAAPAEPAAAVPASPDAAKEAVPAPIPAPIPPVPEEVPAAEEAAPVPEAPAGN